MEVMRARGHDVALFSMADPRGHATAYDRHFLPLKDFKENRGLASRALLAMHAIYSTEARKKIGKMIEDFRPRSRACPQYLPPSFAIDSLGT
jgi:hypothetical protein